MSSNLILVDDDMDSPSQLPNDVIFGSNSPSPSGVGGDQHTSQTKQILKVENMGPDENAEVCAELHAKALYFAKVEALEAIDDEMKRRCGEINHRNVLAKKMIQKKQH